MAKEFSEKGKREFLIRLAYLLEEFEMEITAEWVDHDASVLISDSEGRDVLCGVIVNEQNIREKL